MLPSNVFSASTWGVGMRRLFASTIFVGLVACGDNQPTTPAIEDAPPARPDSRVPPVELSHEVWVIDQSNTYDIDTDGTLDSGGRAYIYKVPVDSFPNETPEVIELGGAFADAIKSMTTDPLTSAHDTPVRPHFIAFNASQSHAIISYVASGHVVVLEAQTRQPVYAVDVGKQAHVAIPSPDETYILVADQSGKKLHRINTDFTANPPTFTLDTSAMLDLVSNPTTAPSGANKEDAALRPNNSPVVPIIDSSSDRAFVPLIGGGMFVVNTRSSPMSIVAEYTKTAIEPYGLLGIQKADKMYFNSNVGGNMLYQSVVYKLPVSMFLGGPQTTVDVPAPTTLFNYGDGNATRPVADSHGMVLVPKTTEAYLWVTDRAANKMTVIKTLTDAVVNEIDLTASGVSSDPAPDQIGRSPKGNLVYFTCRGPKPLTQNQASLGNAVGATPGLAVVTVKQEGFTGDFERLYPITNLDSMGMQTADPHALAVRDVRDL
jgi:hypothetical protein